MEKKKVFPDMDSTHCPTAFCLSKNALTTGNFAHKIKAFLTYAENFRPKQ